MRMSKLGTKKTVVSLLLAGALALLLGGMFVSLSIRQARTIERLDQLRSELNDQVDQQQAELQKIGLNQQNFFRNLNESRQALRLPEVNFIPLQEEQRERREELEAGDFDETYGSGDFLRGLEFFKQHYRYQELSVALSNFLDQEEMTGFFSQRGLTRRKISEHAHGVYEKDNDELLIALEATLENGDGELIVRGLTGSRESFYFDSASAEDRRSSRELLSFFDRELERIREKSEWKRRGIERARFFFEEPEQRSLLREKEARVLWPEDSNPYQSTEIVISERGGEKEPLFSVKLDYHRALIILDEEEYPSFDEARGAILEALRGIDPRDPEERKVDRALERIQKLGDDDAFQKFLAENGLRLSAEAREGLDYFYFDLLSEEDERYGAFAVLKKRGEIYLTDAEDVVITSLRTANLEGDFGQLGDPFQRPETGAVDIEKLPEVSEYSKTAAADDTLILLCGTHENNADTIMIASLREGRTARLLSVPRDLFYKNRKLGSHFQAFGIERLRELLSELTGLDFDAYISVDMYAFIDVVNLLGGIEVRLEEELVDPTYRVRDNGEWGTLYYPAGTHHLSGVEALRVARSRHTSDDFDRAYRQQLIVKALGRRLSQLHAGNLKEIYEIFQVLHRYVDTDLNVYEMGQLFLKYHDAEVVPRESISTDNVVESTYSNFYLSDLEPEDVDEDFYKGAWILVPVEDDWDLIRRYTHAALYGEN